MEEKKIEKKEDKKFEQVKPNKKKQVKKIEKGIKKEELVEKPKKEKGRKRAIFARIVAIILVLTFVIAVMSLTVPKPVRVLEEMFKELKVGNFKKVNNYVEYSELVNIPELEMNNDENKQKLLYENLEWSIKNIEKGKEEVKVEVEVTNKNFETVMKNYTNSVIKNIFLSKDISMENIENYLVEELQNNEVDKVTNTKVLTIKKQDKKWKVVVDENLKEVLYPGLQKVLNLYVDNK